GNGAQGLLLAGRLQFERPVAEHAAERGLRVLHVGDPGERHHGDPAGDDALDEHDALVGEDEAVVVPLGDVPEHPAHHPDPDDDEHGETGRDVCPGEVAGDVAQHEGSDDADGDPLDEVDPMPAPLAPELLGREQVPADEVARLPGSDEVDPVDTDARLARRERGELDVVEFDDVVARADVGRDLLGRRLRRLMGRFVVRAVAVVTGAWVLADHESSCDRGHQATRRMRKAPSPVAISMMPAPMDLNTSAAEAGRKAMKKIRNATPPQVKTFLTILGYPPRL